MRVKNLSGIRFGRLIALRQSNNSGRAMWLCKCDCGNETIVRGTHLTQGRISSCKCLKTQFLLPRSHGRSRSRIYRIWRCMINRCHYLQYPERHLYGGRGIIVCDRWRYSFENFLHDMGEPSQNLSIDRINSNGNYEPDNCKWSTTKEQAQNRRNPIIKDGEYKRWGGE